MENFIVSARKYRPTTFNTVIGQESITTTLKNAISNNHLAQAYLFCGPRGVGKTTVARIFAKTINCENLNDQLEPCDECESCKAFNNHRSTNIHELDAASNNTVDNIRNLIEQVRIPPQIGEYSIYIIDEVHMLSASAFNAFLKTLEEPPPHAIFILATTEKHKIIPTILSRCQIFDFNRIKVDETVSYLEQISKNENVEYESEALTIIAQKADGAMRDALSIYDQVISFSGKNISYEKVIENLNVLDYDYYFRLTDAFLSGDHSEALLIFNEILDKGFDAHQFINSLSKHFRNLLVCKDEETIQLLEVGAGIKEKYKIQSQKTDLKFLIHALDVTNKYDVSYKTSMNQRLHIELALIEICGINKNEPEEVKKKVKDTPDEKETTKDTKDQEDNKKKEKTSKEKKHPKENKEETPANEKISSFSINNALKNNHKPAPEVEENKETIKKEETTSSAEAKPKEERNMNFSQEDLEKAWQNYADSVKSKIRLHNMLKSQKPFLKENFNIKINLENPLQAETLSKKYYEMLHFLKNELQNDQLDINWEVLKEETPKKNKLYTAEDKFKHLEKKNQNLQKLKQDFNLDFEN
jgi:DNA polymerase-3 subunit gamma/tau